MRLGDLRKGPLLAGLFLVAALAAEAREVHVSDLARVEADVLILGEVHDNSEHHVNQATAVAALRPRALVFEMFGPSEALEITPARRRDADRLAHVLGWEDSGWPDFTMYYPIFVAAPDAVIFGGALPHGEVRRAVEEGAAAVIGGSAGLFGLDAPLDPEEQAIREAGQMAAHCDALPEEVLGGMVEAQRLRDAALARAVIAAMAETGGPVALITGNGHARKDWGVPRMLARALPDATVYALAQMEDWPEEDAPYDAWIVTEPAPREDPCKAFRD